MKTLIILLIFGTFLWGVKAQTIPQIGLEVWYMADQGLITNGANILEWQDQSGNGNHAFQTSNTRQPSYVGFALNSLPAIYFDGGDFMETNYTFTPFVGSESTIFVIARGQQYQSIVRIQDGPWGNQIVYPYGGSAPWTFNVRESTWERADAGFHANEWNLGCGVSNQQSVRAFRNCKLIDTHIGVTGIQPRPLNLGYWAWGNGGEYADAEVSEIIIYNIALTNSQIDQVNQYLSSKWNLPLSPSNLNALATSSNLIQLSWTDKSTNEIGFEILRQAGFSSYAIIDTASANSTSYGDTGVLANTTYNYQVRAITADNFSEPTNEASATTFPLSSLEETEGDFFEVFQNEECWEVRCKMNSRYTLHLIDFEGRVLLQESFKQFYRISKEPYPSGVYVVRIHDQITDQTGEKKVFCF